MLGVYTLTGFRGRIRRRDFWGGLLLLLLFEAMLMLGFSGLMRPTGATPIEEATALFALAMLLWVSAALTVKRLHDRDKSALWYPLFGLAPALCYHLGNVYSSNISHVLSPAQRFFWILGGALWLWALVELGFMPGSKGPNRHGPDPRDAAKAPATA